PPAVLGSAPPTTAMVYPVGDPLDYQRAAPGEARGFAVTRGIEGGRHHARHEGVDLSNRAKGGQVRAVAAGLVVATRHGHDGGWLTAALVDRLRVLMAMSPQDPIVAAVPAPAAEAPRGRPPRAGQPVP